MGELMNAGMRPDPMAVGADRIALGVGSNYPPNVTGSEWQIAGYPPCGRMGCGHEDTDHADDHTIMGDEAGACEVAGCECDEYTPYSDRDEYEPDLEAGT